MKGHFRRGYREVNSTLSSCRILDVLQVLFCFIGKGTERTALGLVAGHIDRSERNLSVNKIRLRIVVKRICAAIVMLIGRKGEVDLVLIKDFAPTVVITIFTRLGIRVEPRKMLGKNQIVLLSFISSDNRLEPFFLGRK